MLQCERLQPLEIERRRDLVIGKGQLIAAHRQGMFEPGKDEDGVRPALTDQGPGPPQFAEVVLGAGEDLAARIGQVRRVQIAKAIDCHQLRLPG